MHKVVKLLKLFQKLAFWIPWMFSICSTVAKANHICSKKKEGLVHTSHDKAGFFFIYH